MKDKIIFGVIGLLIGSIITASCFLVFERKHKNNIQMPRDGKMQMMERPDGKEMPEKPNGENNQNQKEEKKELPKNSDSSQNKKQTKEVM